MNRIGLLELKLSEVTKKFTELATLLGHAEMADLLAEDLRKLDTKHLARSMADGRSTSWTDERRAKFGTQIATAWAGKKGTEAPETTTFLKYTYKDKPPEKLPSVKAVAADLGLTLRTVLNRICASKRGFVAKQGRQHVAYVRRPEDLAYVLKYKSLITGDTADIVDLQTSPATL